VAANPQTKPVDLGCESAKSWQLSSTSTVAIVIITQPASWYSFYRLMEGGRLSRPRHCGKGAQPVLKAVYRSSCRDIHTRLWCDSNLGPLTPQSDAALSIRPLRPGYCNAGYDVTGWLTGLVAVTSQSQSQHVARSSQGRRSCIAVGIRGAVAFCSNQINPIQYDTIRDAILTCARKPTWVGLI